MINVRKRYSCQASRLVGGQDALLGCSEARRECRQKAPFSRVGISNNLCSVPPPRKENALRLALGKAKELGLRGGRLPLFTNYREGKPVKLLRAALYEP